MVKGFILMTKEELEISDRMPELIVSRKYTMVKGFIVQAQVEFQMSHRMPILFFPEIIQW
jgi:hypothetical protein